MKHPIREGIFPAYKPAGKSSFDLIRHLRRLTPIKKIGHAGTLDPFAQGVMILLIGREFTKQAVTFINQDKEYEALILLGIETDTHDPEGTIIAESSIVPTADQIAETLTHFQGTISQIPPMFSAKKINGQKLYNLARKGIEIARKPISVTLKTTLLSYNYPRLHLHISCSKGTYIRSLAHDIGRALTCGAHLKTLTRTRCGPYHLKDCLAVFNTNGKK